jgi:hypothetical protein
VTTPPAFTEQTLREDIVRRWGPAGAHVDCFDSLTAEITRLRSVLRYLGEIAQRATAPVVVSAVIFAAGIADRPEVPA